MKRLYFTLLEIVIAFAILSCVGSFVFFNIHKRVVKKRFHSEMLRLQDRWETAHRLAIAMQTDWKGILKKGKEEWIFETYCIELDTKKMTPLHCKLDSVFFNGKPIEKEVEIDFFSSGYVAPCGLFVFFQEGEKAELSNDFFN